MQEQAVGALAELKPAVEDEPEDFTVSQEVDLLPIGSDRCFPLLGGSDD